MCDDVFGFVREHYFVGEVVDVMFDGIRKPCLIAGVKAATSSNDKSGSPSKANRDIQVKYEVTDAESQDDIQECYEVFAKDISRPKGVFTKDKNKLFVKQHVTLKDGVLVIKDNIVAKKNLKSLSVKKICGLVPNFDANLPPKRFSPPAKTSTKQRGGSGEGSSRGKKQMDINKALMQKQGTKKESVTEEEKEKRREEVRQQYEKERLKIKEDREKEKERQKEEKRVIAEFLCEWNKPRDDLECDDLKDLPVPVQVKCNIPQDVFGDALMIIEFLHDFGSLFKVKHTFPQGVNIETMDKALSESNIDGTFNDLLQMLLLAVFKAQEAEDEVQQGVSTKMSERKLDGLMTEEFDPTTTKAIEAAKIAATWSQYYHGTVLRKMPLDPFTLTELVRLHIMASGSEVFNNFGERGMYVAKENPGLLFKTQEPEILRELSINTVFHLSPQNRVKVMKVLLDQLLTYETYRDSTENFLQSVRVLQFELRQLRAVHRAQTRPRKKEEPSTSVKGENTDVAVPPPMTEAEKAKDAKEKASKLADFLKKEKDLLSQISKLKGAGILEPIGRDRAFRRYWLFRSIGGVFVEDENVELGICLDEPTPSKPVVVTNGIKSQDELPLGFMKRYLVEKDSDDVQPSLIKRYLAAYKQEDNIGLSDKENEVSTEAAAASSTVHNHAHSKTQKLLSDANPRMNSPSKIHNTRMSDPSISEDEEKYLKPKVFGMCTANSDTCPVHGAARQAVGWSFFFQESDIDALIAGLNPRGEREGPLREFLIKERALVGVTIDSCPKTKLNIDHLEDISEETRRSARYKSAFVNIHPNDALENTFREALLDNEDKIWTGGLGFIKVKDRDAWRNSILERSYDMQCDGLFYGTQQSSVPNSSESMEVDDFESQRSSTPTLVSKLVLDMASALLQIGQGVDHKFLLAPLADDERYKKKKAHALLMIKNKQQRLDNQVKFRSSAQQSEDEESSSDIEEESSYGHMPKSPFQRWEQSLMRCTSLSQLFVHLATLERAIAWKRSASLAICRICRRKGTAEKMLLCDGCDCGYHMYCLKPALKVVPTGDWFCPPCEPPVPRNEKSPNYKEESCSEEDEEGEEEQEQEEESEEEEVPNDTRCKKCRKGGSLICCDSCPQSFHVGCADPPLRRVPRGKWECAKCTNKNNGAPDTTVVKISRSKAKPTKSESTKSSKSESEKLSKSELAKLTKKESPKAGKSVSVKVNKSDASVNSKKTELGRSTRRVSNNPEEFPLDFMGCCNLLNQLSQHPDSWPFLRAVTKKEAPNYSRIIKRPIDLGIIRSRLNNQAYSENSQFVADIYLMFQNCEIYNPSETPEYISGKRLARCFQSLKRQYKLEDSTKPGSLSFGLEDDGSLEIPTKRLRKSR